jgi:predicted nucleic acid-binding protein
LRLVDADILSYALYDLSPFNPLCKTLIERAARGELELYVTHTTLLEAYNVLYWAYRVRPRRAILEKMSIVLSIIGSCLRLLRGST